MTGDHGEGLGDHGESTHGLFAYESTLRVPLIVAQLGVGPSSESAIVSDVPVQHLDIVPTVLDALQIEVPQELRGRSLLPLVEGRDDESKRTSYFEAMSAMLNRGWAPLQGVVSGREKYIELPLPELYDLATDPREDRNQIDRQPERSRALRARLSAFGASAPGGRQEENRDVAGRLRALGYVTGSAPTKARYGEEDDPKRLVELDRAIHQGIELIERRRFDQALGVFRGLITRRPDMSLAYRHLAFLHWQIGDPAQAIGTLRDALRAGLTDEALRSQLGIYLAESGSPREAIALLRDVGRSPAPDVDAVSALGIAYARNGQPGQAIETFQEVLRIDRTNAFALQNIGSAHLVNNDLPAAQDAFERALDLDRRLAQAHTGLGVVHMKLGRRDAALAAWQRAVELDPAEFDALYNLAYELLRDGRLEEGRRFAEQFIKSAPPALYGPERERLGRMLAGQQQ